MGIWQAGRLETQSEALCANGEEMRQQETKEVFLVQL